MENFGTGYYVLISTDDTGDLVLSASPAAIADKADFLSKPSNDAIFDLLEDWLDSGWEIVPPEDIGALTSAPILTDEIERDDHGQVTSIGRVWWFERYAIEDPVETLLTTGKVVFPKPLEVC